MEKKCLKCGFQRTESDSTPHHECPKCGAIYEKVEKSLGLKKEKFTVGGVETEPPELPEYIAGILGFAVLTISVFVVINVLGGSTENNSGKKSQASLALEKMECKKSLNCWGEQHTSFAEISCSPRVEKLAKYDFKWGDGFISNKFTHYNWLDKTQGTITYFGDKIKFQNGFGAWQNYLYTCDIDPRTNSILAVRAEKGRL